MAVFSEEFLNKNAFEAVLATFCWYNYDINASEAVERIAIDQKDYHKCSLFVIFPCIATNIVNDNKKGI